MGPDLRSRVLVRETLTWGVARDYALILAGALLQALAIRLFLVPSRLVSGGISGLAQLIYYQTGWPIGVMVLLGNIPLFLLGWRFLGGPRFVLRTAVAVIAASVFTDLLVPFLPQAGLTDDLVLNTLYGGVVSGVGYGLVYRGQATSGGSDILAKILSHWKGISISQSYLLTDTVVILLAGLSFSWENALYALVMLYISGVAAEAASEGSNVVRTATIVTANPQGVMENILHEMERGVTVLPARGGYTGDEKAVLFCVISRSEVPVLKAIVRAADAKAFLVIGQAHEALGEGFRALQGS